jgi:hypothetical protein
MNEPTRTSATPVTRPLAGNATRWVADAPPLPSGVANAPATVELAEPDDEPADEPDDEPADEPGDAASDVAVALASNAAPDVAGAGDAALHAVTARSTNQRMAMILSRLPSPQPPPTRPWASPNRPGQTRRHPTE